MSLVKILIGKELSTSCTTDNNKGGECFSIAEYVRQESQLSIRSNQAHIMLVHIHFT